MGQVFIQINVSLDGYIEDQDYEIDWHFVDDEFEEFINDTLLSIDGMVFGRKAYEPLSQYWPTAADQPDVSARHVQAAELMNSLPKYIVSDSLEETNWANSHVISGDVRSQIDDIKQRSTKDLAVFAGGQVACSFIDLGLIDEFRLIVNPTILGSGTPLFSGERQRQTLELLDSRPFATGAIVLRYRPTVQSERTQAPRGQTTARPDLRH